MSLYTGHVNLNRHHSIPPPPTLCSHVPESTFSLCIFLDVFCGNTNGHVGGDVQCNIILKEYVHINECESLKNHDLGLCTDFSALIAKHVLRLSRWPWILDLGNCHAMFLMAEFVFFADGFGGRCVEYSFLNYEVCPLIKSCRAVKLNFFFFLKQLINKH